jgi:hypothetical protein
MGLNIVTGYHIINEFKKSNFFRQNLGLVTTVDKGNGRRLFNDQDSFSHFYCSQYRTNILGQGNIGDIRIYVDHFIKDSTIAVYYGDKFEEFLFEFNFNMTKEKGINFYLGHILKNVEEEYEERSKNKELRKIEEKVVGDPEMVIKNPGSVTYEDLKAYMNKRNQNRYTK